MKDISFDVLYGYPPTKLSATLHAKAVVVVAADADAEYDPFSVTLKEALLDCGNSLIMKVVLVS